MSDLNLHDLPAELQTALERIWPGCPEAQRRALLGPWFRGKPVWPDQLWAWQPASRWWRPFAARDVRRQAEVLFAAQVSDVLQVQPPRLFDPNQPFFETPWTRAEVQLRSPLPEVFSDADFWAVTQQLFGGDAESAGHQVRAWARGMQSEGALSGWRRDRWLTNALHRLRMSATSTFL